MAAGAPAGEFTTDREWNVYAECPCGEHYRARHGDPANVAHEVCPKCGVEKNQYKICVARWVSDVRIFLPSTWGTGHWEHKPKASELSK